MLYNKLPVDKANMSIKQFFFLIWLQLPFFNIFSISIENLKKEKKNRKKKP